jgi:hypothetical protein
MGGSCSRDGDIQQNHRRRRVCNQEQQMTRSYSAHRSSSRLRTHPRRPSSLPSTTPPAQQLRSVDATITDTCTDPSSNIAVLEQIPTVNEADIQNTTPKYFHPLGSSSFDVAVTRATKGSAGEAPPAVRKFSGQTAQTHLFVVPNNTTPSLTSCTGDDQTDERYWSGE